MIRKPPPLKRFKLNWQMVINAVSGHGPKL